MGGFDFQLALQVSFFLFSIWSLGRIFAKYKLPPILGQLLAGMILGPEVLDMVPYASNGMCSSLVRDNPGGSGSSSSGRMLAGAETACQFFEWSRWDSGHQIISPWNFLGNVGVTLMIMESGMHIHFDKVAVVGKTATIIAIAGTFLPILVGLGVVYALFVDTEPTGNSLFPWGFAAGCAFAPTSVGISIHLLSESKILNSNAGQTVLTAAFIDDVFSLVTLVILGVVAVKDPTAESILIPLFCSFALLFVGAGLAIYVFPRFFPWLLSHIPIVNNVAIQPRDQVHLMLMLLTLFFFGWVSWIPSLGSMDQYPDGGDYPFIGSHLLGAFAAGMCWVNVPRSHTIWVSQLKRMVKWMMRLFFAATVGFAIPVKKMLTAEAFYKGVILGVGPCISTKLFAGIFNHMTYATDEEKARVKGASWATKFFQPGQMLVGIAMVARGEFAYLVAQSAYQTPYKNNVDGDGNPIFMMSGEVYAAVIWALVLATICAPVMFRWALGVYDRSTVTHRSSYIGGSRKECQRRAFVIRISGPYSPGVQREIFDALHAEGVDILDANIACVRADDSPDADISMFMNNFTVLSRGAKKDFDSEKVEEMHHTLAEILNNEDAQIIFEPLHEDFSEDGILEVQIIGEFSPHLLHEFTDVMSENKLDVIKAQMLSSQQPGQMPRNHSSDKMSDKFSEKSEKSERGQGRHSMGETLQELSLAASKTIAAVLHTKTHRASQAQAESSVHGKTSTKSGMPLVSATASHSHTVGREIFYAREADGSKWTSAKRRNDIQMALKKCLKSHHLHGSVLVRLIHESEMIMVHKAPKLSVEVSDKVQVVRCAGQHHAELLHEICDYFDDADLEVVHAEMDTGETKDQDVNIFYIKREDDEPISSQQSLAMQTALQNIYKSHDLDGKVTIDNAPNSLPNSPEMKSNNDREYSRDSSSGAAGEKPAGTKRRKSITMLPPQMLQVAADGGSPRNRTMSEQMDSDAISPRNRTMSSPGSFGPIDVASSSPTIPNGSGGSPPASPHSPSSNNDSGQISVVIE